MTSGMNEEISGTARVWQLGYFAYIGLWANSGLILDC